MAEGSRPQVLVVEDSAVMRGFVTSTLEAGGDFDVTPAENGFQALKILPRHHYNLIITDINMPDINGLELVRFIRDSDRHAQTPLLLISTDNRAVDRERGLKLGADDYLVKPFTPEQLMEAVRRVLAKPA
jgi:two-component system chemotaxis response regulator CheY